MKFNRYWIAGRGGAGREKWEYFEGDFNGDLDEARYIILEIYESWAQFAEYYSMEIELDVVPPKSFVEGLIRDYTSQIDSLTKSIESATEYLEGMKVMKPIKPGYQVHIRSWENDGDNYKTEILSGLSKEEAEFYIFLARAFESRHNKRDENLTYKVSGNGENSLYDLVELWKVAVEKFPAVAATFDIPIPSKDEIDNLERQRALPRNHPDKYSNEKFKAPKARDFDMKFFDIMDGLLSQPGEGYCDMEGFLRVCDKIEVYYVPGEIENVTNQFIN